ncbi:MAG: carbamate kinase [Geodermatophilaceae bacterium]|nr:carbamate kinase [Geodermatophilaceae bacterium]
MRVLIALGGNAMTGPGGDASTESQQTAIALACARLADLIASGHDIVLTHGNGPQVGNLLVKNEMAAAEVPPVPLDWCVAQTQATIGFTIQNALAAALASRGIHRESATLVTRTVVDVDDPAFQRPTKPIGRYLPQERAQQLIEHGQHWEDRGERGWRRMVASPAPIEVLDTATMSALVGSGHVLIAAGGGGIPVVRDGAGSLRGVEAVIDKDLTATLLARALAVDVLLIATDVNHVMVDFGTPQARALDRISPAPLRKHAEAGQFGSGSMGPKVEAILGFVEGGGRRGVITSLEQIADGVTGNFGTVVEATTTNANDNKEGPTGA